MDDDNTGAIDTGESWSPPADTPAAPPPTQPQPQQQAGLPDVGPAPAQTALAQTPGAISEAWNQGLENVKNGPVGRAVGALASSPADPHAGPEDSGTLMDKIKKLLGGEGAINPALLDEATKKVDPTQKMSPADRQVAAIHQAYQEHGPDAALAILQANRVAYSSKAAFARTALTGSPGKPADLNAAIQAANQAQENLPDGSNITFSPGQGGVVANVRLPGTSQPQAYILTVPQLSQFLDVGKDGQFDKMMDHSAPSIMKQIGAKPYKWGENSPGSVDLSGETSPRAPASDAQLGLRDTELEGKSRAMFPQISQEHQRQQWMSGQEQQEASNQNKVDVAAEKGRNDIEKAKVTGAGRTDAAKVAADARVKSSENFSKAKVDAANAKMAEAIKLDEAKNGRNRANIAGRALNAKIAAGGYASLSDEEKKVFKQFISPDAQAPQAPTPQAPAPQAPQPAGQQPQPNNKDQQAMAWAKANPNDPRAKQIMTRLNGAQ